MAVHGRALRRPRDCGVKGMCAASQWGLVGGSGGVTSSSPMLLHPSKASIQVTTLGFLDLGDERKI